MANRSITVTLRANVADFKNQFDAASKAAERTSKSTEDSAKRANTAMGRMVQSATDNRQAWETSGRTLTGFGAAALGGLGLATKAAMDWESSWTGVQKTVDGTAPQMEALEQGLRGLARQLPASHQEIAAVAEAAGQLGISTPNILGFTRTMIDMGEATNMSAEQAATALARFSNIAGTSEGDVARLGATVVGLGNNAATTESEIVDMALRIAGAGAQAGLSEGEMMGMAAALSSVGIEAQAGGSAISQTMKRIGMEVDTGGDKLGTFAQVAGMTAEQFSTAWREDPASALDAFVQGLSNTEQMGMSTNEVLADLGITAIRESDALLRLSGAGDILATNMARGNDEFSKGTALIEEAAKRYETAESRIRMAGNAIVDAGISVGSVFMPVVAEAADGLANMAGAFADLPGPVHAVAGGLAGVAGAVGLSAGGFLLLAPRVLDTVSAFRDLGAISPGTASRVGRATLAVGKIGLAAGVAAAAFPILVNAMRGAEDAIKGIDRASLDLGMNELSSNLMDAADSGDAFGSILGDLYDSGAVTTSSFEDLGAAVQGVHRLDTDWFAKTGKSLNLTNSDLKALEERFDSTGEALVMMAQTDLPSAQAAFSEFWAEAEAGGATFEQVMGVLPGFRDELIGVAEGMGVGTDDATLLRIATGELTPVVDEATGAVTGFEEGMEGLAEETQSAADAATEALAAFQELANEFIGAERGALDYKDALEEANKVASESGRHWEDGTEAADENKRALLDLADQALATAASFESSNESGTFLKQAREDLIDVAAEMFDTRGEAEAYVDQLLGTPTEISTIIELDTAAAREEWDALWEELGYNPPAVPVDADTALAEGKMTGLVSDVPPAEVPVDADTTGAQEEVTIWGSQVGDVPTSAVPVTADIEPASWEVNQLALAINSAGGTVTINGNSTPGDQVLDSLVGIINNSDGTVTIDGQKYPADQALAAAIAAINNGEGTVDIEGDNSGARGAADSAVGHANSLSGTIGVNANTSSANSAINSAARDRSMTIRVNYSGVRTFSRTSSGPVLARAAGGPIHGPGTGTSDSVPVAASNGEHMWTAREVSTAGGHQAIYSLRQQILGGAKTLRLATGGGIENGSVAPVRYSPVPQQAPAQSAGPSTLTLDGSALAMLSDAVRTGASQASLTLSSRDKASIYQDGASASRAYGGKRR